MQYTSNQRKIIREIKYKEKRKVVYLKKLNCIIVSIKTINNNLGQLEKKLDVENWKETKH